MVLLGIWLLGHVLECGMVSLSLTGSTGSLSTMFAWLWLGDIQAAELLQNPPSWRVFLSQALPLDQVCHIFPNTPHFLRWQGPHYSHKTFLAGCKFYRYNFLNIFMLTKNLKVLPFTWIVVCFKNIRAWNCK